MREGLRQGGGLKVGDRFPLGAALRVTDPGHMDVIDLNARRRDDSGPGYATCRNCGEAWFELRGGPPGVEHGAVSLRPDGTVSGYAGVPHCLHCGRPYL